MELKQKRRVQRLIKQAEKSWGKQYFDWPIPIVIKFIRCIFFLENLMKTGIGQSKYCLPQRFHVEKGWDKQYFDWPIPVFIKFIKCIFFLINLIKTGIGQSKYCIPQPFSRCLITLCSSRFDFNSILIFFNWSRSSSSVELHWSFTVFAVFIRALVYINK